MADVDVCAAGSQLEELVTVPVEIETITIDANDIVSRLEGNQLIEFISQIDELKGSYYFSEIMFRLFRDSREAALVERPDLADISDRQLDELFLKEEGR